MDPQRIVEDVLLRYLIGEPSNFFAEFEPWSTDTSRAGKVVQAFRSNLELAVNVGSVPFQLI